MPNNETSRRFRIWRYLSILAIPAILLALLYFLNAPKSPTYLYDYDDASSYFAKMRKEKEIPLKLDHKHELFVLQLNALNNQSLEQKLGDVFNKLGKHIDGYAIRLYLNGARQPKVYAYSKKSGIEALVNVSNFLDMKDESIFYVPSGTHLLLKPEKSIELSDIKQQDLLIVLQVDVNNVSKYNTVEEVVYDLFGQ